jgi:hypothetical protein
MARHFKFNGNQGSVFANGAFTIGKVYQTNDVDTYTPSDIAADACFKDDNGVTNWEEIQYFTEVFDG